MAEAIATRHITRRACGAIIKWFDKNRVPPDEMLEVLHERAAFGDDADLMRHLRDNYSEAEADALRDNVQSDLTRVIDERMGEFGRRLSSATTAGPRDEIWREERPRLLLLHIPDGLFATAIEAAIDRLEYNSSLYYDAPPPHAAGYINDVFEQLGRPLPARCR